jgi:predicted transcriptional regulator
VLNKEIISGSLPALHPHDLVSRALQLMEELHVNALPLADQDEFVGLALEDDLINYDEQDELSELLPRLTKGSVDADAHIMEALNFSLKYSLSVIPVTDKEQHYVGAISAQELLWQIGKFIGATEPGAIIVLAMEKNQFSFSELSKIIETNDAQITQLNTYWEPLAELLHVTVRLNKLEVSDVIATLQRYEYQVKYYFGEELYTNELRNNYDHLMNYLKI